MNDINKSQPIGSLQKEDVDRVFADLSIPIDATPQEALEMLRNAAREKAAEQSLSSAIYKVIADYDIHPDSIRNHVNNILADFETRMRMF